jgi:hypothetical protein
MMTVTIDNDGRYHTVSITGDFTGPYVNLDITPAQAYNLYQRLHEKRTQLYDLATNYYECTACGEMHKNSEKATVHSNVESEEE